MRVVQEYEAEVRVGRDMFQNKTTVSTEPGFYELHEAQSMILLLEGGAVDATYNTQILGIE